MMLTTFELHDLPAEIAVRWPNSMPWQALAFMTALQPIKNMASLETLGQEALLRIFNTTDGTWVPPQDFFHMISASSYDMCWADHLFLALHVARVDPRNRVKQLLFLNIEPRTFLTESRDFLSDQLLRQWQWSPERIVLEVTERWGTLINPEQWARAATRIRDRGFRLALDDWDFTAQGVDLVNAVKPDYVKVTASTLFEPSGAELLPSPTAVSGLANGIGLSERLKLLEACGTVCIVEGIETPEQQNRLLQLNFIYGQGFLLGKPQCL